MPVFIIIFNNFAFHLAVIQNVYVQNNQQAEIIIRIYIYIYNMIQNMGLYVTQNTKKIQVLLLIREIINIIIIIIIIYK